MIYLELRSGLRRLAAPTAQVYFIKLKQSVSTSLFAITYLAFEMLVPLFLYLANKIASVVEEREWTVLDVCIYLDTFTWRPHNEIQWNKVYKITLSFVNIYGIYEKNCYQWKQFHQNSVNGFIILARPQPNFFYNKHILI